ncbi:MAG: hypothetical protein SFZ23_02815 [Planctomycetota bacterium]|nr:hypothetical protein [Planctomycetota bacterium]
MPTQARPGYVVVLANGSSTRRPQQAFAEKLLATLALKTPRPKV